jgi:intein/homing endonuclease
MGSRRKKYSTNIIEIISGEKKEELEQLFIDADLSFKHMRIVTNAHHYNLYGDIAQVVIKYFKSGSSNKQIPQFIREMPKHLIVAFLRGMFAGDGSFQVGKWGRGTITYTTVSKELIEQVAIFLTYLGIKLVFV